MNNISTMEGMLWKWTNYFSGWQPRWFVLDQGILSYYRSQDDIINGCKGSIKMSACNVLVHPNDATRLDLIIPGEAHFYVKAATAQERQQWLVALGTSKACPSVSPLSPVAVDELPELALKAKKSELRLYCDLLMQQVHGVKCAVQDKDQPDIEQLNESTSLLSATCDTFINTLDECLRLANANININSSPGTLASLNLTRRGESISSLSPTHATPRSSISKAVPWPVQSPVQRSTSAESYQRQMYRRTGSNIENGIAGYVPNTRPSSASSKKGASRTTSESSEPDSGPAMPAKPQAIQKESSGICLDQNGRSNVDDQEEAIKKNSNVDIRLQTYFSKMDASFIDIRLMNDLEIPTIPFLDACRSILPIFDKLNQPAFAPARLDMASNIKKIHQKYLSSPEVYVSLQKMILSEMKSGQCRLSSSATTAILWLKRALEFMYEIIVGFLSGTEDMVALVNNAYTKTLVNYHGWIIRGAFAMAVKAVPTRSELLRCLSLDDSHVSHPSFVTSVLHDMEDHAMALSTVTKLLHAFLQDNHLDFTDQV